LSKNTGPKPCAEPNRHVFNFLVIFVCRVTYSSPEKLPLQAQTEFHTISLLYFIQNSVNFLLWVEMVWTSFWTDR
jgi:hypothetical protein